MTTQLPHERLDVYKLYLETAGICSRFAVTATQPLVALDHLDRALDSIGVNLMRANPQPPESPQRSSYLDISIASTHECAASLDVCQAKRAIEPKTYSDLLVMLWRIRGMLLGLKRARPGRVGERDFAYETPNFGFANLRMYQHALRGVRWVNGLMEELGARGRERRKLDISTTGTVLNIAEGFGRASTADQNRFIRMAEEHAFQTLLLLDLMVARQQTTAERIAEGKATQAKVISMLHVWCAKSEGPRLLETAESRSTIKCDA